MNVLLAFLPFLVFVIVEHLFGIPAGLISAAGVSAAMLVRDLVTPGRRTKVLEIGTVILFGGLAAYSLLAPTPWTVMSVRLCVDGGLLLIVLISMAIRKPFTLQYAKETVPKEFWDKPEFIRVNYIITAVWAAAFAVMSGLDVLMIFNPSIPMRAFVVATILTVLAAVKFTSWYPERTSK